MLNLVTYQLVSAHPIQSTVLFRATCSQLQGIPPFAVPISPYIFSSPFSEVVTTKILRAARTVACESRRPVRLSRRVKQKPVMRLLSQATLSAAIFTLFSSHYLNISLSVFQPISALPLEKTTKDGVLLNVNFIAIYTLSIPSFLL